MVRLRLRVRVRVSTLSNARYLIKEFEIHQIVDQRRDLDEFVFREQRATRGAVTIVAPKELERGQVPRREASIGMHFDRARRIIVAAGPRV